MRPPVVLILDTDPGLVFWLGGIFREAGCQAVPALNSEQALSIIRELKLRVDVVVVNPGIVGVPEMIQALGHVRPVKIVAICGDRQASGTIHAHATLDRPSGTGGISREKWLGRVQRLLHEISTT